MTTKTKSENITLLPYSERVKLVRERLANLRRPKVTPLKKPASVESAEKRLRAWEAQNDAHLDAQVAAHRAKLHEVQDALIVGDMARAVALMKQFGA
jgi:predicted RNase H-like nuclease